MVASPVTIKATCQQRQRPYSRVKSRDDPISGRRGDSGVLYCFIYKDY